MYVVVGLGNPGQKYERTRHNAGFMVIDILADALNISVNKLKFKGLLGEGQYKGEKIILLKPQTYMNLSGESVVGILQFYKIPLQNLIIIYDDMDLAVGQIRIRKSGGPGGQNGMKNIIQLLGTEGFPRIRMGIGRPAFHSTVDYVLSTYAKEEQQDAFDAFLRAKDAVLYTIEHGLDKAMNVYNKKESE